MGYRKQIIGEFDMPDDMAAAALMFVQAAARHGYNSVGLNGCNGVIDSVHLFVWQDEGTDEYLTEPNGDKWQQYMWVDIDEE